MTGQTTALSAIRTERFKSRVRLPLLITLALVGPSLAGSHSSALKVFYVLVALTYSLWALRLTQVYATDTRLGYLLTVTDCAVLLPLAAWSSNGGLTVTISLACLAGAGATLAGNVRQTQVIEHRAAVERRVASPHVPNNVTRIERWDPQAGLEAALRIRLQVHNETGARFGLVILRVLHYDDIRACNGDDAAQRTLAAIGRRGIRLLGQDAQRFPLSGGRVAFLFSTEEMDAPGTNDEGRLRWNGPYDIEGLAMSVGRKVCEHLIDGRRAECVVGWAAAPANGLIASDLLQAAEAGAHSTAAFRRVNGTLVAARVVPTSGATPSVAVRPVTNHHRSAVG